jgi:hypothetical protein
MNKTETIDAEIKITQEHLDYIMAGDADNPVDCYGARLLMLLKDDSWQFLTDSEKYGKSFTSFAVYTGSIRIGDSVINLQVSEYGQPCNIFNNGVKVGQTLQIKENYRTPYNSEHWN